jgi:hypothetical protein
MFKGAPREGWRSKPKVPCAPQACGMKLKRKLEFPLDATECL